VLDPHRTAAPPGPATFVHHGQGMDTKTKWVIAGLLLLVLAFLVIGGIMAIASPPNSCC
jgi:hypothetical protein